MQPFASSEPLDAARRQALHDEVHARPPEALTAPLVVTHWAMLADASERAASRAHLAELLAGRGQPAPAQDAVYWRADLGDFALRWEQHTEFVSWTFMRPLQPPEVLALQHGEPPNAAELAPAAWRAAIPGRALAGIQLWVLPKAGTDRAALVRHLLDERTLTGSNVISHSSELHTDMQLRPDGCVRMLVFTGEVAPGQVSPRRLGRLVQRLLEIETYRMAALLALPTARAASRCLAGGETELASLAQAVCQAERADEPALLDRLTRLAAELEGLYAATHTRFAASAAYHDLVVKRLHDIAESRIESMQSLHDFMERRLTPAMSTCRSAARRQAALSERIARMSHLLRTRVEIEQQQSSRELLAAMDRRGAMQLKLQSTVEGLSVAAITYYVVGLIGYLVKGAHGLGWPLSAEATMAIAVPLVAGGVWWSLRRLHHRIMGDAHHR
ncbi:DUF3422 domain-containing protein [Ottowia sp.]|uniref:DUF3422 family protein n=1 Tax=Ottowia sp. TaxID=1898956 RepID=UPI002B81FCA3|nr:DUF3422 domain-containing protein [Ottowia sp.]HRN77507.1 DUF3422 domain-containing protein [Ottowia sp.]HRQ02689.1 DUF3422 domain-containing protein [Ottowia sp.]